MSPARVRCMPAMLFTVLVCVLHASAARCPDHEGAGWIDLLVKILITCAIGAQYSAYGLLTGRPWRHRHLLQVFGPPSTATVTDKGPSQASSSLINSPTRFKTENDGTAAA